MAIADRVSSYISSSSFIRKMFEAGTRLKAEFGADQVCDFSLGNPSLEPPEAFKKRLSELAAASYPGKHGYMPNAGFPDVREAVAERLNQELGCLLTGEHIVMSCGAGGALNTIFKTLLNPGEKVLVSTPCFVEYKFYTENHGGSLVTAPGTPDFDLDLKALEARIDTATKIVVINSPNNPTGRILPEETLHGLADLLERKSREFGRRIYLISDEPYRKIVFRGYKVPDIFKIYKHSIIAYSYSKELSVPGERIGWLAVHPEAEGAEEIVRGAALCTRILGYVNAPALMQKVIGGLGEYPVDISIYQQNRDTLCRELKRIGYRLREPEGTFYLFPEAPGGNDLLIADTLQKYRILVVPGRGFDGPGYFRIAFCVEPEVVARSIEGFEQAFRELS